jgi:hypothetical protein
MRRLGGAAAVSAGEQSSATLENLNGSRSHCFELGMKPLLPCREREECGRLLKRFL